MDRQRIIASWPRLSTARAAGIEVVVLEDAIRGVNLKPGDSQTALKKMVAAGVTLALVPNGSHRPVSVK